MSTWDNPAYADTLNPEYVSTTLGVNEDYKKFSCNERGMGKVCT